MALDEETLNLLVDYTSGEDPRSVHNLFNSRLSFESFFGLNINNKAKLDSMKKASRRREQELKTKYMDFLREETDHHQTDDYDYNTITRTVNNMTRRFSNWPDEEFRYYFFKGYTDPLEPRAFEQMKRDLLTTMGLQYLVHTRVKVYSALAKRELFKHDKRYRIGYLFYRIRRILYDMAKFISNSLYQEDKRYLIDLVSTLRWYQKVMRMDVDLKDTINMIHYLHTKVLDPEWKPYSDTGSNQKQRPARTTQRPNKHLFANLSCYRNP